MFKRFDQHYFELLFALTFKEFTVRYKQAVFGFFWVILNPLLQMIIIGTVFSYFVKIPNYFIYLFTGLLPWQFFTLSIDKTTPIFFHERSLLKKSAFPREILVFSNIFSNLINLIISCILLLITIHFLYHSLSIVSIAIFSFSILWLVVFTTSLSLITSTLNVRFRDITFFTQTILILWFYATPILYSYNSLPTTIKSIISLNPLTSIFILLRSVLPDAQLPSLTTIFINIFTLLILICVGIKLFKKESPNFVDWL